MPVTRRPIVLSILLLAGCARFPALDEATLAAAAEAATPTLIPLQDLLAQADTAAQGSPAALPQGRLASLAARAGALRGSVIDRATRARMLAGVDTAGVAGEDQAG